MSTRKKIVLTGLIAVELFALAVAVFFGLTGHAVAIGWLVPTMICVLVACTPALHSREPASGLVNVPAPGL